MGYITQVTHENKFVAEKVGFFADYFYFVADTLGQNDFVSIDNPLSLIEKTLIQLQIRSLRHAQKSIHCHLSNEWFTHNPEFFKSFPAFTNFATMRGEYLALDSEKKQIKWLTDNRASFATVLDKLRSDLSDKMFSEARRNVVSYTKCKHDIDHHKIDFIAGINCMATEFLLRNHSKTDIKNVFNRLLSMDDDFPFPPDVDTEETRIAFLAARTFDQQFEGIENALTQPLKDYTFVCRVYNASVPDDFEFTYNKVTFYSPKHEKVAGLRNSEHFSRAVENFFESKIGMLACVKAQYHSLDIAKTEAVKYS